MTTITIDLPESVFSSVRQSPDEFIQEMRIEAATQWYARQQVSQEKAAEIAGLSRAAFIDELARRKIPVIQVTIEEVLEEARRAE